jgi:hypothetical protein
MTEDKRLPLGQSDDQSQVQDTITVPAEGELRQFIDNLVQAGELLVKDGETSIKVTVSRLQITNEARTLLAGGGPDGVPRD